MDHIGLVEHIREKRIFSAPYPHFFGDDPRSAVTFHHPLYQNQKGRDGTWITRRVGMAVFEMDLCLKLSEQVEDLSYRVQYYKTTGKIPDESIFVEEAFPFFFLSMSGGKAYIHALMESGYYRRIEDPVDSVEAAEEWMFDLLEMQGRIQHSG